MPKIGYMAMAKRGNAKNMDEILMFVSKPHQNLAKVRKKCCFDYSMPNFATRYECDV
jgi:hypothetical protein